MLTSLTFQDLETINGGEKCKIRLFYLNITSYDKTFDTLLVYLNTIKTKFDLVILGETWLGETGGGIQLKGFNMMSTTRGANRCDR